jgi:hypothetical protein
VEAIYPDSEGNTWVVYGQQAELIATTTWTWSYCIGFVCVLHQLQSITTKQLKQAPAHTKAGYE